MTWVMLMIYLLLQFCKVCTCITSDFTLHRITINAARSSQLHKSAATFYHSKVHQTTPM